jgi:hypothetical protein
MAAQIHVPKFTPFAALPVQGFGVLDEDSQGMVI